jgi:hypothetical protein
MPNESWRKEAQTQGDSNSPWGRECVNARDGLAGYRNGSEPRAANGSSIVGWYGRSDTRTQWSPIPPFSPRSPPTIRGSFRSCPKVEKRSPVCRRDSQASDAFQLCFLSSRQRGGSTRNCPRDRTRTDGMASPSASFLFYRRSGRKRHSAGPHRYRRKR